MEACLVFSGDYFWNIPQGLLCEQNSSMGKEIQNIAWNLLQTIIVLFKYGETPWGSLRWDKDN